MNKNTKIALGVIGVALVGYYIWHKNQASKVVATTPTAPAKSFTGANRPSQTSQKFK